MTSFLRASLAATAATFLATTPATAATLKILHRFHVSPGGAFPEGPLLRESDGSLISVTEIWGRAKNGGVFRLTPISTGKWKETVLYNFPSDQFIDISANGGLIQDSAGALYGTTFENDLGFIYRLSPPARNGQPWQYRTLYQFSGGADGGGPSSSLTVTPSGAFAGVTQAGGAVSGHARNCDCGVAYTLTPPARGTAWREDVAHTFGPRPDGNIPVGNLAVDAEGALYGTTFQGGSGSCREAEAGVIGCGTVFKLTPQFVGWNETILYNFQPTEGNFPTSSVIFGPDGALYGTAGPDIFRLAQTTTGAWQKTTIYTFPNGNHASWPQGGLILDNAGNFYGSTNSVRVAGKAVIFELSPPAAGGQTWTETTLATLATDVNGPQPSGGLIRAPDGTFYGAIESTQSAIDGYIFSVTP